MRRVPFDAPWAWLAAGWRDLWTVPQISLAYGALFAALPAALVLGLTVGGLESLDPGARRRLPADRARRRGRPLRDEPAAASTGERHDARRCPRGARWAAPGQLGFFGAILAFCYFVWLQLASLLFMLFFGGRRGWPPASDFVPTLLFTPHGLGLLVTGTIVGGILAALVFAISVVSVPLLMTRRIDAVSAMSASLAGGAASIRSRWRCGRP